MKATLLRATALLTVLMFERGDAQKSPRQPGKLVVTFFGNMAVSGLAIGVQTPSGRFYLYDAGPTVKGGAAYDCGRDTIAPFLRAHGMTTIDGLILSHTHGDHFGGVPYLLEHFKVKRFIDTGYNGVGTPARYEQTRQRAKQLGAGYQVGAKVYVTREYGTVQVVSDGQTYTATTERMPLPNQGG